MPPAFSVCHPGATGKIQSQSWHLPYPFQVVLHSASAELTSTNIDIVNVPFKTYGSLYAPPFICNQLGSQFYPTKCSGLWCDQELHTTVASLLIRIWKRCYGVTCIASQMAALCNLFFWNFSGSDLMVAFKLQYYDIWNSHAGIAKAWLTWYAGALKGMPFSSGSTSTQREREKKARGCALYTWTNPDPK